MGARLKYTPERVDKIISLLRTGCTRQCAYTNAHIDSSQFHRWLARYAEFAEAVTRAEAEAEALCVAVIRKAAAGWDAGSKTTTTKTVFKMRTTTHPDGTVVEEPVAFQETTTSVHDEREFDWRAAMEWLKRRRPADWGDAMLMKIMRMTEDELRNYLLGTARDDGQGPPESSGDRAALREG